MNCCNCENVKCQVCKGEGCRNSAGEQRFAYIGVVCDPCAGYMPAQYKLPPSGSQEQDILAALERYASTPQAGRYPTDEACDAFEAQLRAHHS